ncbi:ABC transporter permease [Natranaerobius thermophilus]|uniref:Binding-protein-dependent transport systems inner membrane component n=1 Tax=Natranaerobius thermophilus (strain ATCC BAA-1301 / DSM 18059 / JW/NM-WN-LF) TaxID=457570 RepID=B2A7Z2_NATTJ|nr:ABC transporter permease [Natranaerobius thermophilus]ACB85764.1 binding-protein-dependent transport systems inner membrane component [Natranaerobius thermophilus JW/NM-WN-LF]
MDTLLKFFRSAYDILSKDKISFVGIGMLIFFILIAAFAPILAPHDTDEMHRDSEGEIRRVEGPSREHPLGTTNYGRDVMSQLIMGSRIALVVGILAAFFVTIIGTHVGLFAGYYGGWVDNLLMRIVDIMYAIPFIPFVIILVALLEPSLGNIILAISLLTWRTVARIIRSQVLTVVQRPYVKAARVAGASNLRIIYLYILPNVLPLVLLEMSLMMAWAILAEASVSFIGFGDPDSISWGQMLQNAFVSGAVRRAWWWVIPPGVAISLTLLAVFFASRALEVAVNPRLRRR